MTNPQFGESSSHIEPRFETTHWSIVLGTGRADLRQRSLRALCEQYWMPLYAFLRRSGHASHDAQDLTQAFFMTLLERDDAIAGADQSRGRFRAYLLGSLKHFVANHGTKKKARKRGGDQIHLSLNYAAAEAWYLIEPVEKDTPESLFRKRWALNVLDCVLERLEREYSTQGKGELFQVLKPYLTGDSSAVSYNDAATALSTTSGAVKTAAHRMRRRYRELLKAEISHTVATDEEVEDEINQLLNALGG